jgi:hypothetical protein
MLKIWWVKGFAMTVTYHIDFFFIKGQHIIIFSLIILFGGGGGGGGGRLSSV